MRSRVLVQRYSFAARRAMSVYHAAFAELHNNYTHLYYVPFALGVSWADLGRKQQLIVAWHFLVVPF
jgi:hypothetical protein